MKRILIFEDDVQYANACARCLEQSGFEVFHAVDSVEFNSIFSQDKNWDLIIFDAWIDSDMDYTYSFVVWVREELQDQVKLIANSSSGDSNRKLISCGCEFSPGHGGKFTPESLQRVAESLFEATEV